MKHFFMIISIILAVSLLSAQEYGQIKWTFSAGDDIKTCPAIAADGTIYVTSHDGNLYALNNDGSLKWKFKAGFNGGDDRTWINNSPVIGADGTIYIVEDYGTVYALNTDGTEKWHVDVTTGVVNATPSLTNDGKLIISSSLETVALKTADGSELWRLEKAYSSIFYTSPAIDKNGTIFVGGGLRALKNNDGSLIWSAEHGSVESSPAIGADGTIYIGSSDNKRLYAINSDGTEKWAYHTENEVFGSPVTASDGTIYFYSKKLFAINPDGTLKWTFADDDFTSALLQTPVIGADSVIYFTHVSGTDFQSRIYAVNPDGTEKWNVTISDIPQNFYTITNDSLLLYSIGGDLHAMRVTSAGLADSPWPKYKKDNFNTGYTTAVVSSIAEVSKNVPQEYSISDAYPNPFNPTTNFRFSVPKNSQVNISIYNALGQLVDNLVNDTKSSGTYEVTWNASSFGSGIYFVRINAGSGFTQTKKVILMK
jgi:outer membrane protein assembly factor BamB